MRVAVIGLGKIGLPLAVQFAAKGHRVVGADIDAGRRRRGQRGSRAVPRRGGPGGGRSRRSWAPGALRRPPTRRSGRRARTSSSSWSRSSSTADGAAGLRLDRRRDHAASRRDLTPGTLVVYETTLPVGTTRNRWEPLLEEGIGSERGRATSTSCSARSGCSTGRVFADLRRYPKLVGGLSTPRAAEAATHFYEAVLDFDDRPDLRAANGVWDLGSAEAAEMAKLAETTYRDVNIGLANQFAPVRREPRHRRARGHRRGELPALQPHPPPGHRGRRPLHPGLPAALPGQRPRRHGRARRPRGERRDARRGGAAARRRLTATCAAQRVVVLGAATAAV